MFPFTPDGGRATEAVATSVAVKGFGTLAVVEGVGGGGGGGSDCNAGPSVLTFFGSEDDADDDEDAGAALEEGIVKWPSWTCC